MIPQVTHQHSRRQWTAGKKAFAPHVPARTPFPAGSERCLISRLFKSHSEPSEQEVQFFTPQQGKQVLSFKVGSWC